MRTHMCANGLTIVEVLVSMAVIVVVFAMVIFATIGLQRGFIASEHYFSSQGNQTRLLDYIATDTRRSLASAAGTHVVVFNGTTYSNTLPANAVPLVSMLLPNFWNEAVSPAKRRTPTVEKRLVSYGSAPVRVTYFTREGDLYRIEVDPDLPSGDSRNNARLIAEDVGDFAVNITLPTAGESLASASVTFVPKYKYENWGAAPSSTSSPQLRAVTVVNGTVQIRNKGLDVTSGSSKAN